MNNKFAYIESKNKTDVTINDYIRYDLYEDLKFCLWW